MTDIALPPTVLPQSPSAVDQIGVHGHQRTAVSQGAEVFRWVKAKCAEFTERTNLAAANRRPMCLRTVLDHIQALPATNVYDAVDIGRLTVQMDGDNRSKAMPATQRLQGRLGGCPGIIVIRDSSMSTSTGVAPAISIAATVATAVCETVRTESPWAYAQSPERDVDGVRAATNANRSFGPKICRELSLAALDLGTEDVTSPCPTRELLLRGIAWRCSR